MATFEKVLNAIHTTGHFDEAKKLDLEITLKEFLNMFGALVSVRYIQTIPKHYHDHYVGEIKNQLVRSVEKVLNEGAWDGFDHSAINSSFKELVEAVSEEAKSDPKTFASRF